MFSLLLDKLPTTVTIDNTIYKINSNFRVSILFELMMLDNELTEEEKITTALELYYPVIPTDLNKAIEEIIKFYSCGANSSDSKGNGSSYKSYNDVYNFEYDSEYIYSAFMDQYNIDLNSINYLHWWKFKAMFKSLKDDNMIVKIMGYRSMDLSKVKDKEQKAYYRRMQKLYEIPISKDEQNKLDDITIALLSSEDLSKVL